MIRTRSHSTEWQFRGLSRCWRWERTFVPDHSELDHEVIRSVAEQLMTGAEVAVEGRRFHVTRTGARRFRTVRFLMGGKAYQAIEQNPEKLSTWGKLAREGYRVVQFRDLLTHKYVAVSVDGELREYQRK